MTDEQARWGALRAHLSRYGSDPERIGDFIWLVTGWPDAQERVEVVEPYLLKALEQAQQTHSVKIAARWLGRYDGILKRLAQVQGRARINKLDRRHVRYWLSGVVWVMVRREHMPQERLEYYARCEVCGASQAQTKPNTWIILSMPYKREHDETILVRDPRYLVSREMLAARGFWAERWQGLWGEPFDRELNAPSFKESMAYSATLITAHEAPELPP